MRTGREPRPEHPRWSVNYTNKCCSKPLSPEMACYALNTNALKKKKKKNKTFVFLFQSSLLTVSQEHNGLLNSMWYVNEMYVLLCWVATDPKMYPTSVWSWKLYLRKTFPNLFICMLLITATAPLSPEDSICTKHILFILTHTPMHLEMNQGLKHILQRQDAAQTPLGMPLHRASPSISHQNKK